MPSILLTILSLVFILTGTAFAQEVYVIDSGNSRLYKADKNTAGQSDILLSTLPTPHGIAVDPDNGDIYYTDGSTNPTNGRIIRVNKDGTNQTIVASGLKTPTGIALDAVNDMLYFVQYVELLPSIFKVSTSGSPDPTLLISGITTTGPIDVDVDTVNNKIYWTDARGASIRRATTAGLSEEVLVDNISAPLSGIAVDSTNGFVYWINDIFHRIDYISVAATAPATALTAVSDSLLNEGGLAVDGSQSPVEFFIAKNSSQVLKATHSGAASVLLSISNGASQPSDVGFYNVATPTPTPTATPTTEPLSSILNPGTQISDIPVVTVAGRKATIVLRYFSAASLTLSGTIQKNLAEIELLPATSSDNKLLVRYDVKVSAAKKKDSQRLLSKRNQLALKGLKPGNYTVTYSATAYQKKSKAMIEKAKSKGKTGFTDTHKKVFSTNFSPPARFTIQK